MTRPLPTAPPGHPKPTVIDTAARPGGATPSPASWVGFDIFDTVLTRDLSPPEALFAHVGRAAALHFEEAIAPGLFASARRDAEQRSYRRLSCRTTLADIQREVCEILAWEPARASDLVALEIAAELTHTRVVPRAASLLAALRAAGHRVVFISDMYLPSEFLRELLLHHQLFAPGDEIFVSCEHGADKRSGRLFSQVLDALELAPANLAFHGNHPRADINGARLAGLPVRHLDAANPNRYELALGAADLSTDGLGPVLAGASRLTRLVSTDDPAVDVIASVLAPLLTAATLWAIETARRENQEVLLITEDLPALFAFAGKALEAARVPLTLRAHPSPEVAGALIMPCDSPASFGMPDAPAVDLLASFASSSPATAAVLGTFAARLNWARLVDEARPRTLLPALERCLDLLWSHPSRTEARLPSGDLDWPAARAARRPAALLALSQVPRAALASARHFRRSLRSHPSSLR